MSKRMIGLMVAGVSGAALVWLGYNIAVDEMPKFLSFLRVASDPDTLVKWTWPLAFAAVGGALLAMQKPEHHGKKKPKKA